MIPAQVTRMSTEPPCSLAASIAASTSARLVTSQRTAWPPISAAVCFALSSSKSATTTVAPSDASRRAVAAPIPFAPPVTTAVLPSNLVMAPTVYGPRMEFRDILRRRRMHRAFLPDPIPREQIERIAGVIRRAPSGGFSQGGSIVVITDEDVKRELIEPLRDVGHLRRRRAGADGASRRTRRSTTRATTRPTSSRSPAASRSRGRCPTGSSTPAR